MFQQVRWYFLQFIVAVGVFAGIEFTIGTKEFGLAPAIVSMAAAWGVTALVSWLIDLTLRRRRVGHEFKGHVQRGFGARPRVSDGTELVRRPRIGQDRR